MPDLEPDDRFPVDSGFTLGRIYFTGGGHPSAWNSFRVFGPVASMRFDHHPPPPAAHPTRAVTYLASTRDRQGSLDPLRTCLRECFEQTNAIDVRAAQPRFCLWRTTRALEVLDVVDSNWIVRARGNASISSGARGMSRRWARAIYRSYPGVAGIYYQSSTLPSARSIVLYERGKAALPRRPDVDLPLAHPGLRGAVERAAADFAMDLVV